MFIYLALRKSISDTQVLREIASKQNDELFSRSDDATEFAELVVSAAEAMV